MVRREDAALRMLSLLDLAVKINRNSNNMSATLYGFNILSKYTKKADLVHYLNELHKSLCLLSQEINDRPKGLKQTALQLVAPKLLSNADKDVRVLCTCCIVDILRIFAPEAPFSNEDTISAFKAIVTQLRGLATYDSVDGILTSKVYYILNSISTVQSCVVPVILGQGGVSGADDVVQAMFEALLSSVRPEHPEEVLKHAAAVMQICIEELEGVNEELLDVLLLPLLPHNKTDHPTAYLLVAEVLRRVSSTIEAPLSKILQQILVGASHDSVGCSSEISEHIYALIYELHKISPSLLNEVLPNLCLQLQVEEEEIRLKAVRLLGSLFTSQHADYAKDFNRDFKEYLGRCGDLSAEIRLDVVDNCALLLQNKPALRNQLEEPLTKRLRDPDERVRMSALCKLVDLAYGHPTALSPATYAEMGERVKDKRPEVRRLVMVGLAKIYGRHVSSALPTLSSFSEGMRVDSLREVVDPALLARLEFIPGMLMKCWGYPEMGTKHLVLQLVQEQLLPRAILEKTKDSSSDASSPRSDHSHSTDSNDKPVHSSANGAELDDRRATALLLLFEGLTAGDKNSLSAMLGFKSKARAELQAFLKIRATPVRARASSAGGNAAAPSSSQLTTHSSSSSSVDLRDKREFTAEEHMKALRKCMLRLMQIIPSADKKSSYMEKLYSTKDRTIFRLLDYCVSPQDTIVDAATHREDLKRRLDSKSTLGEYMGIVYDVAGYLAVNAGMVQCLLAHLDHVGVRPEAAPCSELLVVLAKHSPQTFQGSVGGVSPWLATCVGNDSAGNASSSKSKHREVRAHLLGQCLAMLSSTSAVFENDPQQPAFCGAIVEHVKHSDKADICARLSELVSQVVYYSPYGGSKSSKEESAVHTATSLLSALSTSKALSLRNKRLDCDLAVLASLCVVPKAAYSALNFSKPSFLAMMDAIRSRSGAIVSFVKDSLLAQAAGMDDAVTVRTLTVGLRALTSVLCTLEELKQLHRGAAQDSSRSVSSEQQSVSSVERGPSADFRELVQLLFECIESSGATLSTFSTDAEEEKEFLFETAAACAFSLMKIKSFAADLTVPQWHALGWTLLHPSGAVRQRLFSTLSLSIQMHPLHPKFLAYPCLFATDEALYPHAEQALCFAVQRLRRTHEELCSQAIGQAGNIEKLQKLANSLMPETVLPYLLHLLSYHPEFPSSIATESETDKKRMKNLVRSVRMLLHVLQHSLINDSCNMSYLFKQLNTINQYYLDRHNIANCELHFMTRMTVKILSEQIKTSDNFQNHPGEIHLPAELFQRKSGAVDGDGSNSAAMALLGGSASGLEVTERAIDKVLQLAGKGNKNTKLGAGARSATTAAPVRGSSREDSDVAQIFKGRKRTSESPAEDGHRKSTDRATARSSLGSAEKAEKAPKVLRLPEEAPTRAVPKRSAKDAVSNYREPVENDREMEKWEQAAAQAKKPRRSSELSLPSATDLLRSSFSSSPRFSGGGASFASPVAASAPRVSVSPRRVISTSTAAAPTSARRHSANKITQDDATSAVSATSAASTPVVAQEDSKEKDLEEESDDLDALFQAPVEKNKQQNKRGTVKERALQTKTNLPTVTDTEEAAVSFDMVGKGTKSGKGKVNPAATAAAKKAEAEEKESEVKNKGGKAVAAKGKAVEPAAPARRSARPIRG